MKGRPPLFLLVLSLALFPRPGAFAQQGTEEPGKKKPEKLREVQLKAESEARKEARAYHPRVVLDRKEIERSGAWNVLDALRTFIPGVYVSNRSFLGFGLGPTAGGILSIRGTGGKPNSGVLVLVDGVPSRMGLFGHPLQDLYVPEDIERVVVTEGPSSDLYGGSALGGAVEIRTRRRRTPGFETEVTTRLGRYATWEETVAHGGKKGPWDYYVTEGYRTTEGHRENSNFRMKNGTLRLGYDLGGGYSTWIHARGAKFAAEDPFHAGSNLVQRVSRRGFTWAAEEETEKNRGRLALFYEWGDHSFTDGWDSEDETWGFSSWRAMEVSPGIRVAGGVDWTRYGGKAWSMSRTIYRGEHFLTETSGFLRGSAELGGGFRAAAGARADHVTSFGTHFLPASSLTWEGEVEDWETGAGVSYARAFRAPTIAELHYPFPAFNPDLDPELADNVEVFGKAGKGLFRGKLSLFAVRGHDAIQRQGPPPPFSISNTGPYRQRGVEATVRVGTDEVGVRGGTIYLHHEGISPGAVRNRWIYGVYAGSGKVPEGAIRWRADLFGETVLGLWGQPGSRSHRENFTDLSATGSLQPLPYLEIMAGVRNLLDSRWHEIGNLTVPGRAAWIGLKANF